MRQLTRLYDVKSSNKYNTGKSRLYDVKSSNKYNTGKSNCENTNL